MGYKLLALRKDADISRDTTKVLDSSSAAIISKVEEILVSCKEMKSRCGDDSGLRRPELSPKWIALLTLEKACLSKISLEGILWKYLRVLSFHFIDSYWNCTGSSI